MLNVHSKRTEPGFKPYLFIFAQDSKDGYVMSKTSQGTGSINRAASGLAAILLREDLFTRQRYMIEISKYMVDVYFADYSDIPAFIHKFQKAIFVPGVIYKEKLLPLPAWRQKREIYFLHRWR